MTTANWFNKILPVVSLNLDSKNPRLGRETASRAPREIVQHLFEHDKAFEVAASIATRGFFPNEPLLAIKEKDQLVVVEGNRRLAALKALREPGLLDGALKTRVERLSRRIPDLKTIASVPVIIAPNRRVTDKQIAGRHIGTPVLAWQAENRASFILEKLAEGYDNDDLRDELGFSESDIQQARQTRAIADMARSLDLPGEVKAKLDNPRAKIFTTLERIFDSSVGREYLHVEPDSQHGIRGNTTKKEFVKAFSRLVSDVALGHQSSRTLNTNENIKDYFESWRDTERPKKGGKFVPSDVITGKSVASAVESHEIKKETVKSKQECKTVLPKDLKIRYGGDRLIDIRRELIKMRRKDNPNAGAVLLRVFFELSAIDFLERIEVMSPLVEKLGGKKALPFGAPTMKQIAPELVRIAKKNLSVGDANKVEKAIRYDAAAPFSLSDLHAFVHQSKDLPGDRDIWQFWLRTEPLFRLMFEKDPAEVTK